MSDREWTSHWPWLGCEGCGAAHLAPLEAGFTMDALFSFEPAVLAQTAIVLTDGWVLWVGLKKSRGRGCV